MIALLLGVGCDPGDQSASPSEGTSGTAQTPTVESPARKAKTSAAPEPEPSPKKRQVVGPRLSKTDAERVAGYQERLRLHQAGVAGEAPDRREGGRPTSELIHQLEAGADPAVDRLAAIVELGGRQEAEALGRLRQIASDTRLPSEERVAALESLAECPQVEHLPMVASALDAGDEAVRTAGVWLLSQIPSEAALPLWQRVMAEGSPALVELAFEALREAPEGLQTAVAVAALRRGEAWMTEQALVTLGGVASKASVEALIPLIDHPVSGDLAHDGLMALLGESFDSSEAARRWWQANQGQLDPTLQPVQ